MLRNNFLISVFLLSCMVYAHLHIGAFQNMLLFFSKERVMCFRIICEISTVVVKLNFLYRAC